MPDRSCIGSHGPLPDDITAGELYEMLSEIGAVGLIEALAQMESDAFEEVEQVHDRATYAPEAGARRREDRLVRWTR